MKAVCEPTEKRCPKVILTRKINRTRGHAGSANIGGRDVNTKHNAQNPTPLRVKEMVQQHVTTYKKNSSIVRLQKEVKPQRDSHARNLLVKEVIREAAGMAPYERRILELLRLNKDRQAVRFANKRIGKFLLAKKKVAELNMFK